MVDINSAAWTMASREATEITPTPVIIKVVFAATDPASDFATANAVCMSLIAACWAFIAEPEARVCANIKALLPEREDHTPSRVTGLTPLPMDWIICTVAPVGSLGSND
ncbi:hypothetical protein ANFP_09680 [Acidithiobacillus ferrooxidans]|nr:hypothetical protein ANFP_09680 [Acidithiobacillus ferrooxidans]